MKPCARGHKHPASDADDHHVARSLVFGAPVVQRPLAFGDRLILEVDALDAGEVVHVGIAPLFFAVDHMVVAGVGREPKPSEPIRCIGKLVV